VRAVVLYLKEIVGREPMPAPHAGEARAALPP
jgi:hypothetical protein